MPVCFFVFSILDIIFCNNVSILNNINSHVYIDIYFFMSKYIFLYFYGIFLSILFFYYDADLSFWGLQEYFTYFSLALKYVNYLGGVGVCGVSLLLNSHTFFL